jgi:hypothetical protein
MSWGEAEAALSPSSAIFGLQTRVLVLSRQRIRAGDKRCAVKQSQSQVWPTWSSQSSFFEGSEEVVLA